jgi:antitoxin (DNA-binding transcriptional repressor) of toxin-antitoxin stability system
LWSLYGHHVTMTTVSTAELKTHLGKYLQMVRNGESVEVTSHRHAVAELAPVGQPGVLAVIPPSLPMSSLKKLKPVKLSRSVDGVGALIADRRGR